MPFRSGSVSAALAVKPSALAADPSSRFNALISQPTLLYSMQIESMPDELTAAAPTTLLLQEIMLSHERASGLRMSFDDLTGTMTGMHRDVPTMSLDWDHQTHTCSFCNFAKNGPLGDQDCVRNKIAVNRLAERRREGFHGYCHLGLLDLVEPLIYHEHILGVFYYGSIRVREREEQSRQKIESYCRRRRLPPAGYLEEFSKVPAIDESSIPQHREVLRLVARIAHYFCDVAGIRPEIYRRRLLRLPYWDPENRPPIVRSAIEYVTSHIDQPFIVKDMAVHLNCHPDFLSKRFKQHTGMELRTYLNHARVERAKRLLENPKLDIGDAAEQSGFSDRVHFSKVFRRITGLTPGEFQKQSTAGKK